MKQPALAQVGDWESAHDFIARRDGQQMYFGRLAHDSNAPPWENPLLATGAHGGRWKLVSTIIGDLEQFQTDPPSRSCGWHTRNEMTGVMLAKNCGGCHCRLAASVSGVSPLACCQASSRAQTPIWAHICRNSVSRSAANGISPSTIGQRAAGLVPAVITLLTRLNRLFRARGCKRLATVDSD